MKLKPHDLLVVCLFDITDLAQWISTDVAESYPAARCAFCGWFVSEDKNVIRIAHSIAEDGDKSVCVIPKGCIAKIQKVQYDNFKF